MTISESKGRLFFTKFVIDSHNESNRFESRIGMLYCRHHLKLLFPIVHNLT